ncbi:hypothetical protein EDI_000660 [Entamoeba dispar SAW760]|uniref:Uncharacterized protein n=1 Tax=Entamoeba dispar (strain ATCC PRA-260 / SAW760) TaxID=370354 RepID=B0EEJ1_ENTDS|nr:uncharacterized protein EDI_000660 [Entamoeba dispar SAW760]EDR27051.1 hypothetical protein EDI_000660 [Entamoeba dispar SAW760]|eukprot:EDR27051.1 hypothetical protein EDI_000660 [Entamoeba dispar SAW760]
MGERSFDEKHQILIPIIGNFGVGKTSLLFTFTEQDYEEAPIEIGRDYIPFQYKYKGEYYEIHLWDTNGSEKYGRVTSRANKGDGYIIVCSYDNGDCLENIGQHIEQTMFSERFGATEYNREAPFTVVCTKHDLLEDSESCAFTEEDFKSFCEDNEFKLSASDLDYSNWDSIGAAFKPLFNQAIQMHLKRYEESEGEGFGN